MRLYIAAVGKLRAGPEAELIQDYLARAGKTGRSLGLGPAEVREVEDRKVGGPSAEATLLLKATEGPKIALDERGKLLSSPDLAAHLARWRDDGQSAVTFMIGGADGLAPEVTQTADLTLSFGPMVWPHMLVRVMLAEQIYRATTILAGTPYHRV